MRLQRREVQSGGGVGTENYLKLADGQSVTGVFRGEAYEFWQKWPKGGEKEIFTEPAPGAKSRFKLNFVIKAENGVLIAKVWEFGLGTYNELAEIHAEYPLPETTIKITRSGTGTNTKYSILPLLKTPLTKAQLAKINEVPLHVLDIQQKPEAIEDAESVDADEVPF
jgi:hypothetical protein